MKKQIVCMLIDDDIDDKEIFEIALSDLNHDIDFKYATGGVEALEMFSRDTNLIPDYIFLDLNMPRMNGSQCLTEIKNIERLKNVPVIMYSTSSNPKFIEESKMLGAFDYVIKPPSISDLSKLLSKILIHKNS